MGVLVRSGVVPERIYPDATGFKVSNGELWVIGADSDVIAPEKWNMAEKTP